MIMVAQYVFWIALFLVIYTYVLYPCLLLLAFAGRQLLSDLARLARSSERRACFLELREPPAVTIVVPAYNEAERLPAKIANLKQLNYPVNKLEIIFVSDGSSDGTNQILAQAQGENVRTLLLEQRAGKPNALNQAVAGASHAILVLCDAATLFAPNAVRNLVRHFEDPTVGAVCGTLRFEGSAESRHTEGVYWKYETILRLMEARLGATLTASGALYALRRECYPQLTPDTILEDLVIPMHVRDLGYRVLHDPEAIGIEFPAAGVAGEFTRRVRLAVGSFRALGQLSRMRLRGFTSLAFFSHKFLRWILPFLFIAIMASSAILWRNPVYQLALVGQALFYGWAGLGFLFRDRMQRVRFGLLGYFLVAMHLAFLVGFWKFLVGRGEATWQKAS